jgi:transposase-like protein
MGLVIAIGVNRNGDREVLGLDLGTAENGFFWKAFLESLTARGLHGVKLAISDAHPGLKEAIGQVFTGIPWQRCRVHFMRNVLSQVPKKYQGMVSARVRTIFTADKVEEAKKQLRMVVDQLSTRFPKAMQIVIDAEDEVLTYMSFPQKHWQQIYSSNVLERLNKEIRRRFNVVSVSPDRASVIRLGGAVIMEQHDEWLVAEKRYLSAESMDMLYLKAAGDAMAFLVAVGS